jgi:2-phospho-L-lactate guanylyltransferase (CobY/MobA/RfbA family)
MARFRRLARDDERLSETLAGLTYWEFAMLMLKNFVHRMAQWLQSAKQALDILNKLDKFTMINLVFYKIW